jgi:hypothetical protein
MRREWRELIVAPAGFVERRRNKRLHFLVGIFVFFLVFIVAVVLLLLLLIVIFQRCSAASERSDFAARPGGNLPDAAVRRGRHHPGCRE